MKSFHETSRMLIYDTDFTYLLPHPALRSCISNYTITFLRTGLLSDQYTVMPHGSATLVFTCDKNSISSSLFGAITKPACVGQRANSFTMLFIVEFQPAGFYAFSRLPQNELTDLVFSFENIHSPLHRLIAQQLEMAHSIKSLISEVDKLFLAHLRISCYQQAFSVANQMIVNSGGQLSVRDISQSVSYSERHLNRMFNQYLGINIKSYSRLVRINKALRLLQRSSPSILQICLQTGFYDIPHFIHDFKSICGITPLEYRDKLSDFYSEIAKF